MRGKVGLLVLLGAAATLGLASLASATGGKTRTFSAVLTVAKEASHPKPGASGRLTATLSGRTLTWKLTFRRLTGPAGESHIHGGPRGPERFQAVIVPLCGAYLNYGVPCKSGMTGTAKLDAQSIALLVAGKTYVNVHTTRNPEGEIRGTIRLAR